MEPPYYFVTEKGRSKIFSTRTEYQSVQGVVSADQIERARPGESLQTHLGSQVRIYPADDIELIESFSRGPQAITLKDALYIIGRCAITRDSLVVESGTGSASMAAFLSLYAGAVISYERREEFYKLSKKNLAQIADRPAFAPIELVHAEFSEAQASRPAQAVILDMPEPWTQFPTAHRLLADTGSLACYTPNITQAIACTDALSEGFEHVETVEIMRREWSAHGRIAKPKKELMHTAFLVFARVRKT